jgi:sugar phosphate isomerase/epimerase
MSTPRFSVIEAMMPRQTFEQDLEACLAIEADGIGLNEEKLDGDDATRLARLRATGLGVSSAFPTMQEILPGPYAADPPAVEDRLAMIVASIERLAPFNPSCINITTGPLGDFGADRGRAIVVDALRELTRVAGGLGQRIAIEIMHPTIRDQFSFVNDIPDALALLDDTGASNIALALDAWHVGDSPEALGHLREHAARFATFHVDDWREPTRSWADRTIPGDGVLDLEAVFGSLDDGGFDGWFELEIISDDGSIEQELEGSLWKGDALDLITTGRRRFMSIWESRRSSGAR